MKPICVLLAFAHTFSCFRSDVRCTEVVTDWLQTDSYRQRSDYRNNIWSYRNDNVNEDDACNLEPVDGIIKFGPDTDRTSCKNETQIYRWQVNDNGTGSYDVDVTISSLHLDENAGNYLIISPGSSLVRDEASVIITGEIQKSRMFRVIGYNRMTVLLVIPKGITNDTFMNNNFTLSYKIEDTSETPDTTPTPTTSTPDPGVERSATVYVTVTNGMFNNTTFTEAVAKMADMYCRDTANNITINIDTRPDDVKLLLISACPLAWPNWQYCIRIVMEVKVSVPADTSYELTRSNIIKMWASEHANEKLGNISLQVYVVPYEGNEILELWLPISLAVAVIFTGLMVALWRFNIFNTSNKKEALTPPDSRTSNVSKQSWVSNNSYQEVPPMTDLQYDDIYSEPKENRETAALPNTHSVSHERPPVPEFTGAYYFQPTGYENPTFDHSSERPRPSTVRFQDCPSSDDDSSVNTSMDTRSHHDRPHTAPKQVMNEDKNNESGL